MRVILFLNMILVLMVQIGTSQVIESNPAFPTETGAVTITFYANRGNEGLVGFNGDVYAHTGVITDKSTSDSDWKYVKTDWGQNTLETKLTRTGSNTYFLQINNPRTYYGVPSGEKIEKLAFVFRSATAVGDSYREGKDEGNADIFQIIYSNGLNIRLDSPSDDITFVDIDDSVPVFAVAGYSGDATLSMSVLLNGQEVETIQNDTLDTSVTISSDGLNIVSVIATDGTLADTASASVFALPESVEEARPEGIVDGINKTSSTSVTLSLFAPQKNNVFVIGDFNDWTPSLDYMMKRHEVNEDSVHFWLEIENLEPTTQYGFQYLIDGNIRTGDPYSELILDPWNDQWINENYIAYPNLPEYPSDKTESPITLFTIEEDEYEWMVEDFDAPDKNSLVFYELLMRDFVEESTYRTLIDTLGYLKNLGVNALKLMPIAEFDGNDSWGYNPAYHMALDKYYGTKNQLKELVDSCHANGIAVVVDVVFNHATGLSPLIRMYQDENGQPSTNSIYAFPTERHPFNVFNDLNHASTATNYWFKRVTKYWIEEFKIDGYRFDLSKGHYIGNTTDVGVWSSYNQWRIDHWKDNFNYLRSIDDDFLVILEHLGSNDEERQLAEHGMMLWGKMTDPYNEATMGYNEGSKSDFRGAFHVSRGWTKANLVSYMESHDEERLMFKNLEFGNDTNPEHDATTLPVATKRMKAAAAFFFTIPGPKMMWQFGELGYDVSIEQNRIGGPRDMEKYRTSRKPILWQYFDDPDRNSMYKVYGDLIKLRTTHPIFYHLESSLSMFTTGPLKRMELSYEGEKVNIVGNFDVVDRSMSFDFPETGVWYDFYGDDSLEVSITTAEYVLQPGEFRIYSTYKFDIEPSEIITSNEDSFQNDILPSEFKLNPAYPNPFNPTTTITFELAQSGKVQIDVFDSIGRKVSTLVDRNMNAGSHQLNFDASRLSSGMYLVRMQTGNRVFSQKITLIK